MVHLNPDAGVSLAIAVIACFLVVRAVSGIEKSLAELTRVIAKPVVKLETENAELRSSVAKAWEEAVANDKHYWLECHNLLDDMNIPFPSDGINAEFDGMPGYYLRQRLLFLKSRPCSGTSDVPNPAEQV